MLNSFTCNELENVKMLASDTTVPGISFGSAVHYRTVQYLFVNFCQIRNELLLSLLTRQQCQSELKIKSNEPSDSGFPPDIRDTLFLILYLQANNDWKIMNLVYIFR